MSRAQSPTRDNSAALSFLADKMLQVTEAIQDLRDQMNNLRIGKPTSIDAVEPEHYDTPIKTYDKAMHLIPEFDGSNVESFISHVQLAVKRLERDQHELFLCGIIAQKLINRTKGTIRIDATTTFPQFYEKLRFLYGKARNLSALEVQRDTCIQRPTETVDDFINRFLQIHDEIINTVNSQGTGITTICIQEEIFQQKAIEVFRRNIKPEIGDHLYSFELETLNQACSKARAFEGELQLRKMRLQRHEVVKKIPFQKPRFQFKECTYCKKRGHEEKECRTKAFHQRSQQNFRERRDLNQPPGLASRRLHATDQEDQQERRRNYDKDLEERTSEHPELD